MDSAGSDEIVLDMDNDNHIACLHSNRHIQFSTLRAMYHGDDRLLDVSLYGTLPTGAIAAELRPVRAHKSVLAFTSKHLYDLFTSDGYIDSHQSEYRIDAVNHESLRLIVSFIYTDELQINAENAVDLLITADYLLMKTLVVACEKFLADDQQVTPENCVKLWLLGRKLSCFTLMDAASTMIAKHLKNMPKYAEFLSMAYDDFAKLIMCEALVTTAADPRCLTAIAWLEYDSVGRASFASDVVNMVPLTSGLVSLDTIREARECAVLREHAPETLLELSAGMIKRPKLLQTLTVASRGGMRKNCWYIMGGDESAQRFWEYDISLGVWSSLSCLPWQRKKSGACVIDSKIILIGGYKNGNLTTDIDEYELLSNTWSTSSVKLSQANFIDSALCDKKQVYAVSDSLHKGVEKINLTTKEVTTITTKAAGLSPRTFGAAAIRVYDNGSSCIYFAGGVQLDGHNNSVEKHDTSNGKSSKVGELLTGNRKCLAATLAGDDLYLIGGLVNKKWADTDEIFNIRTGQNRTVQHRMQACDGFQASTVYSGSVICALGGIGVGGRNVSVVEAYDTREGKWSTGTIIPDMPTPASWFAFASV